MWWVLLGDYIWVNIGIVYEFRRLPSKLSSFGDDKGKKNPGRDIDMSLNFVIQSSTSTTINSENSVQ